MDPLLIHLSPLLIYSQMNSKKYPIEVIRIILSHLDGDSSIPNRTVCQTFYKMIDDLISEGIHVGSHYNIFLHLLRIPNLSLSTLQFYFNDIPHNIAYIMLLAFANQHNKFDQK
jgi:hypothetical protein